jgi:hypothetical protein
VAAVRQHREALRKAKVKNTTARKLAEDALHDLLAVEDDPGSALSLACETVLALLAGEEKRD